MMQQYNGYVHVHAVIAFRTWEFGFGRFDVISTVVWSYYDGQFTCNKFVLHLNSRCKSFCHRKHGLTGAHTPDYLSGNLRTVPLSMKGERKKLQSSAC